MDIIVRKATKADCSSIVTMIKELTCFHGHEDAVKITPDVLIADGFGDVPLYFSLVAEVNENNVKKMIGFVLYYQTYSTWIGKSFFMEDLYVAEAYRRKGIGKKFLKKIINHALREGANKVCWNALEGNTVAHEFYKNAGAEMYNDLDVFTLSRVAMEKFLQTE